jgi:MazG family protein
MSEQFQGAQESFLKLLQTVAKLRDPIDGCPWDLEQDSKSLLPYLLEEAQEFISTVEHNDLAYMDEELGDVLFQVILHSQIGYEKNLFTIAQICEKLSNKLIKRHPHVFEKSNTSITAEEVKKQWNKSKITKSGLEKLHDAMKLSPILAAQKIGNFSNGIGFDWDNAQQVLLKVDEEVQEVKEAIQQKNSKEDIAEEIGDLLFSTIQLARHCDLSADYCLNASNKKFQRRFEELYKIVQNSQKNLLTMSLEEKEQFWTMAKTALKSQKP